MHLAAFDGMSLSMQCQEVMKRDVRAVAATDDVLLAARIMRDEELGFLPVCDEAGRIVGVLTDRDVALRVCAEDARAAVTPVSGVMSRGVISCEPTDSLGRAQRLMRRHRVTRIIVMGGDARPLGVVSLSDVAQYERPSRVGQTLRTIAERKYAPERP